MRAVAAATALLLVACASRSYPAPAPPPPVGDQGLRVTLVWSAPVDLDLYLTDPAAETLYFANNPTRAGARLTTDVRCPQLAAGAPPREEAVAATPAAGGWRVGVDFIDACGSGLDAVPFRIAIDVGGRRREAEGVARAGRFTVVVVEFRVDGDGHLVP
ncbi:MAG TPA: hypothetical protein VL049_30590 [Candidatus Dormibacteraeota bacterium]|nr:hypothetical protein [Candidatus Dormibacteraeota bacterium]